MGWGSEGCCCFGGAREGVLDGGLRLRRSLGSRGSEGRRGKECQHPHTASVKEPFSSSCTALHLESAFRGRPGEGTKQGEGENFRNGRGLPHRSHPKMEGEIVHNPIIIQSAKVNLFLQPHVPFALINISEAAAPPPSALAKERKLKGRRGKRDSLDILAICQVAERSLVHVRHRLALSVVLELDDRTIAGGVRALEDDSERENGDDFETIAYEH